MKKLLIIPMLFACYIGMGQSKRDLALKNQQYAQLTQRPILLDNIDLRVAGHDFPEPMNWEDANRICNSIGWILPNKTQMLYMQRSKDKIKGFKKGAVYWGSELTADKAWGFDFDDVGYSYCKPYLKSTLKYVRAVR
jgi:hypothetical protein